MSSDDAFNKQKDGADDPNLPPKRNKVLEELIDDPLQKEKETVSKEVGETNLPSLPIKIVEAAVQNDKSKEALKEKNHEVVDKDYIFYFINHHVCKPMENGFEDMIQWQSNLQEMQLWSQKQLSDLELKVDNANENIFFERA